MLLQKFSKVNIPTNVISSLEVNAHEYAIGGVFVLVILRVTVPVFDIFPSISERE